jgi:hypothetical protein
MHRLLIWTLSMALGLVAIGVAALVAHAAEGGPAAWWTSRIEATLRSRWAALTCGMVTAAVVWWAWGSLDQVPVYDDERAYVLQAEIFAAGHWTAPAPPFPEFFQQLHVLEAPAVAAKYPPGHALALVPGTWAGLPGLIPLGLAALSGALVFALARRLGGPWVGLMTWWIWVTQPATIQWRATYFSETTTAALCLLGWWAVLEWRARRCPWMLALLGVVVGWGAITRPLTMLVFAIPVAVVVVRDCLRLRRWNDLAVGLLPCLAVLALLPLWSARTTGSWRETPLARYTREYIPWDHPGFGYDSTPPRQSLPADRTETVDAFVALNRRHTVRMVPRIALERAGALIGEFARGWRRVLIIAAVVGLIGLEAEGLVAVATAALLVLAYLTYVHFTNWTVYYLEMWPVPAYLAARGLWRVVRSPLAVVVLIVVAAPFAVGALADVRRERAEHTREGVALRTGMEQLGPGPVVVFVRYGPHHRAYAGVVGNTPDPSRARAWIVYDLGDRDSDLVAQAPGRRAYRYDESLGTFTPLALARPPL